MSEVLNVEWLVDGKEHPICRTLRLARKWNVCSSLPKSFEDGATQKLATFQPQTLSYFVFFGIVYRHSGFLGGSVSSFFGWIDPVDMTDKQRGYTEFATSIALSSDSIRLMRMTVIPAALNLSWTGRPQNSFMDWFRLGSQQNFESFNPPFLFWMQLFTI